MSSGFRKQFDELRASANDSGDTLYSIDIKPIYAAKGDKSVWFSAACFGGESRKYDGDWLQIEITGWTESAGRQRCTHPPRVNASLLPRFVVMCSSR